MALMPCTLELQPAVLSPEDARDRTRLGATPVGDGTSFVVVAPHALNKNPNLKTVHLKAIF